MIENNSKDKVFLINEQTAQACINVIQQLTLGVVQLPVSTIQKVIGSLVSLKEFKPEEILQVTKPKTKKK